MNLKAARTARTNPVPFQPPLAACMMGQMGLFVYQPNLATDAMSRPMIQAKMCLSSFAGCAESK